MYAKRKEKYCTKSDLHLSYYNLHTADAHIDLFELYKILED